MNDLNRLVTAVETGDHNYYHGDVRDGVVAALKELVEIKETLDAVIGKPTLDEMVEVYETLVELMNTDNG